MKKIIASLFTAALIGGAVNAVSASAAENETADLSAQLLTDDSVSAADKSDLYTTKDVQSELRLRAEESTESEIVGTIPPGALIKILSVNGDWASAEYGSSKGYVSTAYIRKIAPADSAIAINNAVFPEWFMPEDAGFTFAGSISSNLVVKRVWGGVYKRDGKTEVLTAEIDPESDQFDTASFLNKSVDITKVGKGSYTYKLFAEDAAGKITELISSDFTKLGTSADYSSKEAGDIDGNGKIAPADADMLQKYLVGDQKLSTAQYILADVDRDTYVNAFDLVLLRQSIIDAPDAPIVDPENGWSDEEAGTYTTKNVNTNLNIRKAADTAADTLGSVPAGAKFKVTQSNKDWAYIEYGSIKGYVSKAYIQKYEEPKTDPEEGWSTDDAGIYITKGITTDLNIRESASEDAKIIGTIPRSARFRVTKTNKDWVYVDYKGLNGYASMTQVQKYVEPKTDPEEGWSTDAAGTYTTLNVTDGLNIRASASTSANILGTIPANAKFSVTKTSKDWAYAEYNGVKGYVSMTYIQKYVEPKTDPEEGWSTDDAGIYITKGITTDLNIRDAARADANIIGTIPKSAKFKVTKTSKNWVYVDYKGLNGYAPMGQVQKYVEQQTDPEDGWTTTTAGTYTTLNVIDGLNIRASASTSANILGTIPANAKFSVTKTSKDWAYAEYNGVKGYVSMTYIQKYVEPKTDPEEGWSTDDAGIYITKGLTTNLNVREAPSADAKIIGTIPRSAKFNVTKTSKDWVYVDYKGHNGYASMSDVQKYVELEEGWTATTAGTYTTYNVTDALNIRAAASTSSDILGVIPAGATFKVTKTSKDWAYAEYIGFKGYVSMSYIQLHDPSNEKSVQLDVMEFNQNPNYPTGCESAALYMLLKYYDVNVTMEQIVKALPKGPLPYYSNGTLYGANPETEFVGDPHNSYAYGVFNEPLAKTAEKFKTGVKTKKDSSIDEIIALLKAGKPVVAWYTTSPGKAIAYNDSWYDYKTGKLIRWPAGEHAVVVCGFDIASKTLTYRDPYTGGSRTVSFSMFEDVFNELGSRILYY
ncbi:MAG: SH3 domain-containing protein [Ruminococcus sp.]|nr:SH3 domain-containing protein [Ruminococcus sp.]